MSSKRIDISHKTIFFVAGFLALLWALYQIIEVIILLFIAIILMAGLSPIVNSLQRYKIPKAISIALSFVVIVGFFVFLLSLVVTPLVHETQNLIKTLPQTFNQVLPPGMIDTGVLQQELGNFSMNAVSYTLAIFGNILGFISVLVLTFYLLMEREKLDKLVAQFFTGREELAQRIVNRIEYKLGSWLRGQLMLSLIIGVLVYTALFLLQIPFALPLAIIAGLFEVVPVIGPIISAIPAILIAFTISPLTALFVAGAFFLVQQLENHLIVPQVMKKAVGLNPLIVILAVSIGGKLLGISGALLAVPIAVVVQVISEEILKGGGELKDLVDE